MRSRLDEIKFKLWYIGGTGVFNFACEIRYISFEYSRAESRAAETRSSEFERVPFIYLIDLCCNDFIILNVQVTEVCEKCLFL